MVDTHICIISLKCYDVLSDASEPRHVGGNEINLVSLARGFVRRGYRVSIIVHDQGQRDEEVVDGIRVHKAYRPSAGVPVVRFFSPRWSGLWSAMERANAGIVIQMGSGAETGQVALWCRRRHRRFIFLTAADADCIPELSYLPSLRERWLYRYGLRSADRVVCQTKKQQADLKLHFGIDGCIILSSTPDPVAGGVQCTRTLNRDAPTIAWVGRFVPVKRLEWLLDLAETLPKFKFVVAGWGDEAQQYVRRLIARGGKCKNVNFLGRIPPDAMDHFYQSADLLVCTSIKEGVPTVFIEAWARGIPVFSTVDPDGMISGNGIGAVVPTILAMRTAIKKVIDEKGKWLLLSQTARKHYERHHTPQMQLSAYESIFRNLTEYDV